MLTPRHRALFEASYSALLLRTDSSDRQPSAPPPAPGPTLGHNDMTDKDFGPDPAA